MNKQVNEQKKHFKLAYLISRYPAISHTFILREIRLLRGRDLEIDVASINGPDREDEKLTTQELEEKNRTYYVKRQAGKDILPAHFKAILRGPLRYLKGLGLALSLGGADLKQIVYGGFYFAEAVLLGEWMAKKGIRHVHIHFANPAALVGLLASRIFGITYSLTVHGPTEFFDVTKERLAEKIGGALFVVCISDFAKSQLMKVVRWEDWQKLEVIPLGVELDKYFPPVFRGKPETFEMLCVGRLVPAKGQKMLIEAVNQLVFKKRKIKLRLIGDGPERKALESEVKKRGLEESVLFEGSVGQNRIMGYFQKADFFVLPSFAEGVPVSLMEAMAMKVPCISTNVAGIPELIENNTNGLLVPPSNVGALVSAIEIFMDNTRFRCDVGEAGRRRIEEKYDLRKNILKNELIFRERINKI